MHPIKKKKHRNTYAVNILRRGANFVSRIFGQGSGVNPSQKTTHEGADKRQRDALYFYASKQAYKPPQDRLKQLHGYNYVSDMSNPEAAVYVNHDQKKVLIAFRGTVAWNWEDIKTDIFGIALGNTKNSARFQRSKQLANKVYNVYRGYKVETTGHSLGGSLAQYVTQDTNGAINSVVFNPGGGINEFKFRKMCASSNPQRPAWCDKTTAHVNANDPVSMLAGSYGETIEHDTSNLPLTSHKLDQLMPSVTTN
jgi:hypothetical protein